MTISEVAPALAAETSRVLCVSSTIVVSFSGTQKHVPSLSFFFGMLSSLMYSLSRPDKLLQDMAVLVLYFSQEEGLVLRGKDLVRHPSFTPLV